jgi:hypothetical protein
MHELGSRKGKSFSIYSAVTKASFHAHTHTTAELFETSPKKHTERDISKAKELGAL